MLAAKKFIYGRSFILVKKMAITAREHSVGAWTFLIGVILALIIGVSSSLLSLESIKAYNAPIYAILIILGIIVGFTIKTEGKESETFLYTGTILIIISKFGMDSVRGSIIGIYIGDTVASIFAALLTLFVPATIIVAIKRLFSVAKI